MGYPDENTCCVRFMRIAEYTEKKNMFGVVVFIREVFTNEGGEGPDRIFCHLFISAFLVNKRGLSSKMAIT